MSAQSDALISKHIEHAIAAERRFETQLRGFLQHGDDEEVHAAFVTHADEVATEIALLTELLHELRGGVSENPRELVNATEITPHLAASGVNEEQTLQNLITACTIGSAECAMYRVVATVAQAAGNKKIEALVRDIEQRKRTRTETVWHFLPSRSKIAFNMLTLEEVDPAVETRAIENRLVE